MSAPRKPSTLAQLSRRGFVDAARARRLLTSALIEQPLDDLILDALGSAADPDLALNELVRLLEAAPDPGRLLTDLLDDPGLRIRLTALLGVSSALADHLVRHPDDYLLLSSDDVAPTASTAASLRAALLQAVGADDQVDVPVASAPSAIDNLRIAYRRQLLQLAARDLTDGAAVDDVAAELADMAAAALDASLAIARAELPDGAEPVRLALIGLGK